MYILFVRHGQSTANLLQDSDPFYIFKLLFHSDARLSSIGVEQSKIMAINIINMLKLKGLEIIPLIFTSVLSRAIQTANNICNVINENENENENVNKNEKSKNFKTVVIPYIEEIPLTYNFPIDLPIDLQNQPRNLYNILAENFTNYETSNLDFDIIPYLNPYDNQGNPVLKIDPKKFYESLPIIRSYILENGFKLTNKSVIIIVSHRKTIKEITGLTDISLGNLGLVLEKDTFEHEVLFDGF